MKNEITTVAVSIATKKLIERIMQLESERTGYRIKSVDIVNRAVRDLAEELKITSPVAVIKSAKKLVKKIKKSKIGKAKWTPSQRAKFRATMAAKKKPVETVEILKEEETSLQTTV